MQKDPADAPDAPDADASFQSILNAISESLDASNPHHQNFVRCLYFIASEPEADKAGAKIPEEIKAMICESVQEILKELEPVPKLSSESDAERQRTKFSLDLELKWLPNLPKFMSVVPVPKPKPVAVIKVEHERTPQPLSPKESVLSPKHLSTAQSTCIVQPREKPPSEIKPSDRRASVPVKNKIKRFFSRHSKSKTREETREDNSKNQSQSF